MAPRQIHEIGLSEVKRIRAEMDGVIAATHFQGSFAEFVRFLHTDPRFFYTSAEDLVEGYRATVGRAELQLASHFGPGLAVAYKIGELKIRRRSRSCSRRRPPRSDQTRLPPLRYK